MSHSPPPARALPLSHTHARASTHRHKHGHDSHTLTEFTLLPSFGQDTAQCSEAPFSIFVVTSAWLLREREGAGAQDGRSGCRATVGARVRARGRSSASPTAAGGAPPRAQFPSPWGGKGFPALSATLPLQISPLLAGTCVLPMRKPWVPAWLPSSCGSHLLRGDPHSPLAHCGGGGATGWHPLPCP